MRYFKDAITKKYAQFNGRAGRKEFWRVMLILDAIFLVFTILYFKYNNNQKAINIINIFLIIYSILIITPYFAVQVRRLHDIGKSWTYVFLRVILIISCVTSNLLTHYLLNGTPHFIHIENPAYIGTLGCVSLICFVWLMVLNLKPGEKGPNKYGNDPRQIQN